MPDTLPVLRSSMLYSRTITSYANDNAPYEKIMTFELGYGFSTHNFNLALNGYYTRWNDKTTRRQIGDEYANITGLDAVHMGVELEATYKPVENLELKECSLMVTGSGLTM